MPNRPPPDQGPSSGSGAAPGSSGGNRPKARVPKSTKPAPTSKGNRSRGAAKSQPTEPVAPPPTPVAPAKNTSRGDEPSATGDGGGASSAKAPSSWSSFVSKVTGPPTEEPADEPAADAPRATVKPASRTGSGGRTTPKKAPAGTGSKGSSKASGKPSGKAAGTSGGSAKGTSAAGAKTGSKAGSKAGSRSGSGAGTNGSASGSKAGTKSGTAVEVAERPKGLKGFLTGPPDPNYVPAKDRPRPWWGMGDMALWFFVANVLGGVAVAIGAAIGGYSLTWPSGPGSAVGEVVGRVAAGQAPSVTATAADVPFVQYSIVQLIPLWIAFLGGPYLVVKRKGTSLKKDFGFTMVWKDIPLGLAIGIVTQVVLITVLYRVIFLVTGEQDVSAEAERLVDRASSPFTYVLLFILVAFGSPVFEELFFRGLSQRAIGKRLGPIWGLVLAAVFFALVHGQYLQFPGLLLFGLILGYLAMRFNRLGPSIWAHIGFNMVTAVILIWNQIVR